MKRGAPQESLHVIFEAALPNPDPAGDLLACRPVAEFWANLSAVDSMDERRARLEQFFFDGLPGFAPVVHPDHYRVPPAGIRTLQITAPSNLVHFFQYRIVRECASGTACTKLYMKPDVLENTMFGGLFDARVTTATATGFRAEFLKHVKTLVIRDLHLYTLQIPDAFLAPDTQPTVEDEQPSFVGAFEGALSTTAGIEFRDAILAEARKAGNTTLTPTDILRRVQTQTCAGCHFGGVAVGDGINFPLAGVNSFRHITETLVNGRYNLSPAMNLFMQHRMQILRDFLAYGTPPVHSN